ncbi:MAG: hypothetical protein CMN28_12335 [Salinisphaeraceae bacterium]|nr:hypothetical protein [Salinisphaeraceae bacterium]
MKLQGASAVITGAGSGIGRALALASARRSMGLLLADVSEPGLADTQRLAAAAGAAVVETQLCDVSRASDVKKLADVAFDRFDSVALLCNNAGVAPAGPLLTSTAADWRWVMNVNLMGVVHGIQSFLPRMLEQCSAAQIVNTASVAGLIPVGGMAAYTASKHAVVATSECLHLELAASNADVGVSVLCPAYVDTNLADCEKLRPAELAEANPKSQAYLKRLGHALESGRLSTDAIAELTLDAAQARRFYVLPHPEFKSAVAARMQAVIDQGMPPAFAPNPSTSPEA